MDERKVYKIIDGRVFEILDKKEKLYYIENKDLYIIENENIVIIDLDKEAIKPYVKYLIKGMEWSRELGAIIFNRYIIFIIFLLSLFCLYSISEKPWEKEIIEIIKNNWVQKNMIQNITNLPKDNVKDILPKENIVNLPKENINK